MKEILEVLWNYFQRHPLEVLFNIVVSAVVIPMQDVLLPHLYGKVISALEDRKDIIRPFVIVIITIVIVQLGFAVSDWDDTRLIPDMQAFLRVDFLQKIFDNFQTNFQDLNIGDILSSLLKLPNSLSICFERVKNYIIPYTISFIVTIIYFAYHDIYMGVSLGVVIAIYLLVVVGSPLACRGKSVERDIAHNALYEEIDDMLRNLISVFTSDEQDNELKRLQVYEEDYKKTWTYTMYCALKARMYVLPVLVIFLVVFMWRCYHKINVEKMPASKFVPLSMILLYVLGSMMMLTDQIKEMIFEIGILSNVGLIHPTKDNNTATCEPNKPLDVTGQRGIYFDHVTFTYPDAPKPILSDVTFSIKPGEKVGIVGDIGSGKSTLLKLLLKLKKPTCGEIYVNGFPFSKMRVKDIRRMIGYVPQQPILFNRSVLDNIKYGNPHVTDKQVEQIITNLGLEKEFVHLEKGLHTKVGKNGTKISGGQRQLVWCIRVLLSNPEILILDEPTASLDDKTKKLMISLLNRLMQNRTVIMVTHDQALVQYAERLIVIQKGSLISHVQRQ